MTVRIPLLSPPLTLSVSTTALPTNPFPLCEHPFFAMLSGRGQFSSGQKGSGVNGNNGIHTKHTKEVLKD